MREKYVALVVLWVSFLPVLAWAEIRTHYFNGSDHREGFYLIPDDLPNDGTKAWVAVDVHGAGGLKGEGGGKWLFDVLEPVPLIVIVPSFTSGYQAGDGEWAQQMIRNFKEVAKKYPVHDKMFLHGHSGGAQFVHRFAFNEPEYVIGVSAHSAGSWACDGGYGEISIGAKGIPFLISCGEKDTQFSVKDYPYTRIEWYKRFAAALEEKGFVVNPNIWPESGHSVNRKLYQDKLKECFLLGTHGMVPGSDGWKGDVEGLASKQRAKLGTFGIARAPFSPPSPRLDVLRAANRTIQSGKVPDPSATLRFLAGHPASSWADKEEFAALREHCERVATEYLKQRRESGNPLSGDALDRFRAATAGLTLED